MARFNDFGTAINIDFGVPITRHDAPVTTGAQLLDVANGSCAVCMSNWTSCTVCWSYWAGKEWLRLPVWVFSLAGLVASFVLVCVTLWHLGNKFYRMISRSVLVARLCTNDGSRVHPRTIHASFLVSKKLHSCGIKRFVRNNATVHRLPARHRAQTETCGRDVEAPER